MEVSIRITSDDISHSELKEFLDPLTNKYIIGLEQEESNRHFQIYAELKVKESSRLDNLRYAIKKRFPEVKGNGKFSISVKRTDQLKIYVCKEGKIIYKGFTPEEIEVFRSMSYNKPISFSEKIKKLEESFLSLEIFFKDAITQYINIHLEHSINFTHSKVDAWITRLLCTLDDGYKEIFINKFIKKYNDENEYIKSRKIQNDKDD